MLEIINRWMRKQVLIELVLEESTLVFESLLAPLGKKFKLEKFQSNIHIELTEDM